MATRQKQGGGGDTQNDYSRKIVAVQRVLGDPSLYPDEFKSWITRWLYGNVNFTVTNGQLPAVERDHLVGASGEIPFQNSWVNFGGSNEPARYWKDYTGNVHIGGTLKSGTINTTMFTLPAGYRPQYAMIYAIVSNGVFGGLVINPDGTVVCFSGNNTYVAMSGVTFRQFA
jgi:hypothetical protein